ncbi:MAG TPA: ImmA/IrrE family metallo-endopeptidase [Verrucomicrobiae bacterium]|nr:ImmA/IrrE family metallo-endopeptidase [Verrucomicrobiae bacterium]
MRWVRDPTGRFPQRPHFEAEELDARAEQCVEAFLQRRRGQVAYPLTTNDLVALVESRTADLDLYADLTDEGSDVEGVTYFAPGGKPAVQVSRTLDDARRETRQRMTLAHELGHVDLHNALWPAEPPAELFPDPARPGPVRCLRRAIERPGSTADWMEWQAAYFASALLMPQRACRTVLATAPADTDREAVAATAFHVSRAAAHVRLIYLGPN